MKRSRIEEVSAESGIKVASDDDRSYLKGVSIMLTAPPIRQATDPKDVEAEDERDQSEFGETELCPYCGNDTCPHHAASLDLTFRQVVGGELYDAIEACLERITTMLTEGEDADVRTTAFERLEEVLEAFPEVVNIDSEWHGGPGQSSAMRHYWVEDVATMPGLATRLAAIDH